MFSTDVPSHEGTTGRGPVNGHYVGVLRKGKEPLGAQWRLALQGQCVSKGGLFLHLSLHDTGQGPSGSLEILLCAVFVRSFCVLYFTSAFSVAKPEKVTSSHLPALAV